MSTFPSCLCSNTVIMSFDHSDLPSLNAQKENRCLMRGLLLLNWLFPSHSSPPFRNLPIFFLLWMGSKDWLKKDKGTFCSRPTSPHWYFAEPSLELTFFLNKFCATFYSLSAQCDMMLVRESPAASPHAAGYPSLTLLSCGGTIKSQFTTANMYLRGANQPLYRGRLVFN